MTKVFISYDREDSDFAELVKACLEKAGHDTLLDTEFLNVGNDWRYELDQAIRGSHVLLVIMTPEAAVSDYVTYEWAFALGAHGKIIPLELKKVSRYHPRLDVLQRLDFTDKVRPWEALLAEVAKVAEAKPVTTIPVPVSAPPVIQQAVKSLDSLNEVEQKAGIKLLAKTDHPAAREALVMALQHPVESVRITAALEIPDKKDVRRLPGLISHARNVGFKWREGFHNQILGIGLSATPCLLEALQDQSSTIRNMVADALGNVGDVSAVPSLIDALQDKDKSVRNSVVKALGKVGDATAIPALHEALKDVDEYVPYNVVEALGKIGDATAIPALHEALKDVDVYVRHRVVEALGKIGDATAIPALHEALKDVDESVRRSVVEALSKIGDATVIPALHEALKDESDDIRVAVIRRLGELNDDTVANKLLHYLQDDFEARQIHTASAVVLGRLGVIAASPKLRQWLKNKDEFMDIRTSAAEALGLLGDKSAINDLREVFSQQQDLSVKPNLRSDKSDRLGHAVSVALIRLQGVQVFPLLIESLRTVGRTGLAPIVVVEAIGTVGEPAIPALRDILNFDDDILSKAAAEALKTIGTTESLTAVKQWERSQR